MGPPLFKYFNSLGPFYLFLIFTFKNIIILTYNTDSGVEKSGIDPNCLPINHYLLSYRRNTQNISYLFYQLHGGCGWQQGGFFVEQQHEVSHEEQDES